MGVENLPRTLELTRDEKGRVYLLLIDQRKLPGDVVYEELNDYCAVMLAIKELAVRGAPALGVAGAAALVLFVHNEFSGTVEELMDALNPVAQAIAHTRPTAVNLSWGVERIQKTVRYFLNKNNSLSEIRDRIFEEVKEMEDEDEARNRAMGKRGASLLTQGARVLTHCNAGSLATVFYGTALGVFYAAASEGKIAQVYVDETRPVNQGARLTAWELAQAGVPCTLICDATAASLMAKGCIDAVFVGADRICAQGDTANKIGTYGLAVLAAYHKIPFYVVAPSSTFDGRLAKGSEIEIEERGSNEITSLVLAGVEIYNPAFDITPASLITAFVTEEDIITPSMLPLCI